MPDPERILQLLRKAIAAFRETPGRAGRHVELVNAEDVFATGDLHGHVGHFKMLLQLAELGRHPRRHFVLQELIHGPFQYPDGSDNSHQLLDLLSALKCQYPDRVHFLPGNHELAQVTCRPIARAAGDLNILFRAGVNSAYGDRGAEVYAAYGELIRIAPLSLRTPNRVFLSHSLPPAAKLPSWNRDVLTAETATTEEDQPGGSIYHLVWGRDVADATAQDFLSRVDADLLVTGHLPCERGFLVPNDRQLILDSQEPPAGYCLFPANRPITHSELVAAAKVL